MSDRMTTNGLPPYSFEAEQSALGAAIMSGKALDHAMLELRAEDFLSETHGVIFDALCKMRSAGDPVDEQTVIAWLKSGKRLTAAGGAQTVMSVVERVPVVSNHKAYVREVKDHALLRALVATAHDMASAGYDADPAAARESRSEHPVRAALEEATGKLIGLRDRVEGRTYAKRADIGSLIDDWGMRYVREQADPDSALAIPFPEHMPQLNDWTMGQRPGRLIVSSGFTGHGKSWFGLDCSETVMLHGGRVAYFALELPADEILERLIGMSGVSYAAIQERRAAWDSMEDRIDWLGSRKDLLTVLDGTTPMQRIEAEVIAARVAGKPYRYVVVDTINLLDFKGRASERRGELDKALVGLKNLAIDHGLTIHLQAQLNRDKSRDPMDPPTLSDLKESSGIEQIADLALFVHRFPGVHAEELSDAGLLVVAKGRNIRRRGRINVGFDPSGLRFRESVRVRPGMGGLAA